MADDEAHFREDRQMNWIKRFFAAWWRAVVRDLSSETEEAWLDRQW